MVRIRLRRQGAKGQPTYRIVVIDQRKARNGKYLENIGYYNPRTRPATEVIKEDRALYWLSVGAQPSDPVRRILDHTGTWERFQRLRTGESMEALVKEAEENKPEPPSPKTIYPAPGDGESKIKADEAARSGSGKSINGKIDQLNQVPPYDSSEEIEDVPSEPDELLEPKTIEDGERRLKDKSPMANDDASDLTDAIVDAFNRPGKTNLNDPNPLPNPSRRPEHRLERKKEEIKDTIGRESNKSQRKWKISLKQKPRDAATKNFLKEEYNGECQICNFTFPRRDGEPHFVAVYIIEYKILDNTANVLCLCPNHFAMFKHGNTEAPDIIEKIKSYIGGSHHRVKFQLIDQEVEICFKKRHIIDLIAFVESIEKY